MEIDLTRLHNHQVDSIVLHHTYEIDSSFYEQTDIIKLSSIQVEGEITSKENEDFELEDYATCTISGMMTLPDSISLEEVEYPFTIEYDDYLPENCIKSENTLDILEFLWENIVLEIPLQFTKESDLSKYHGDGWKLVHEDELKKENNPFRDLLNNFEEE